MKTPEIQPGFTRFQALAKKGNVIPVYMEVLADLLTPVSAFMNIATGADHSFLLESVEGGERAARYSFLGVNPRSVLKSKNGVWDLDGQGGVGDPFDALRDAMSGLRVAGAEDLPPFIGGAIGYMGYDVVRHIEKLPEIASDDLNLPDMYLMFTDAILIFDHVKHRIKIVSCARPDSERTVRATDLARYRELYPAAHWATTKNGTHASEITPAPQPPSASVLLVGSLGYAPNVHGLFWFLGHVLPLLPAGILVTVAGSRATEEVRRRLAQSRVRFVDTPEDLGPLYAKHALCAVPVFQGSGTRGKILEALAYERAVVTTSPGAGGLDLAEGEGFVLADDAERFADAIRRLAHAPGERGALARRGREAVLLRYDWSIVAAELVAAWSACASR